MKNMIKKDEAVSPVVGVMLMLVVTVIIAAVVSSFAGGLAGDTKKAPQASLVATEVVVNEAYDYIYDNWSIDPVTGKCDDIYVVFEHKGGDGINLNNIEIHLGCLMSPAQKAVISNALSPNMTAYGDHNFIQNHFSKGWKVYLEGYPDKAPLISPGNKFVLHVDACNEVHNVNLPTPRKNINWQPDGAYNKFAVAAGDYLTYDIIDKQSKKSISSGQILVRDFGVASS